MMAEQCLAASVTRIVRRSLSKVTGRYGGLFDAVAASDCLTQACEITRE